MTAGEDAARREARAAVEGLLAKAEHDVVRAQERASAIRAALAILDEAMGQEPDRDPSEEPWAAQ